MKKVHITILGGQALPIYYPIQTYSPNEVYLLGTNRNGEEAGYIKCLLESQGITCDVREVEAYNVISTRNASEKIFCEIGEGCEVTVNITGGTKTMCLGLYEVAKKHGATIIYTDSNKNLNVLTDEEIEINKKVSTEDIFALHGQQKKECDDVYKADKQKLKCSQSIMKFINRRGWDFHNLREEYCKSKAQKNHPLFLKYTKYTEDKEGKEVYSYVYDEMQHTISINYPPKDSNDPKCKSYNNFFKHEDVYNLMFEGRWWECLVADAISKWSAGRYEILQNVISYPHDEQSRNKGNAKNEIDVLVNVGNKFIIVECKSGIIDQDVINKMKMVHDIYAGDKSKSVLISAHPISMDLIEKANDAQIDCIEPSIEEAQLDCIEPSTGNGMDNYEIWKRMTSYAKIKAIENLIDTLPAQLDSILKSNKK